MLQYFLIVIISFFFYKNFILRFENLTEFEGEFLYEYLDFKIKKVFFGLNEVIDVKIKKLALSDNGIKKMRLIIYIKLNESDVVILNKKNECILFFKSCYENNREMYDNILKKNILYSLFDLDGILKKEIEKYKD